MKIFISLIIIFILTFVGMFLEFFKLGTMCTGCCPKPRHMTLRKLCIFSLINFIVLIGFIFYSKFLGFDILTIVGCIFVAIYVNVFCWLKFS